MPAGHDKFEFARTWFTEDCDTLVGTPFFAIGVIFKLFKEFGIPLGVDEAFENIVNDVLLFFLIIFTANVWLSNLPVIRDEGS